MVGGSVTAPPHHSRDRGEGGSDQHFLAVLHSFEKFAILVSPNHPIEQENSTQHEWV